MRIILDTNLLKPNLGINEVVFYQTVEPQNKREFGTVSITAIDGVPINQMFLIDLNSGYIKRTIIDEQINEGNFGVKHK